MNGPRLKADVSIAHGLFALAQRSRAPLVQIAHHLAHDGPSFTATSIDIDPSLRVDDGRALRQLLNPLLENLEAHPEQWRRWRDLPFPAPSRQTVTANERVLYDPERCVSVNAGLVTFVMHLETNRVVRTHTAVFDCLVVSRTLEEFQARISEQGLPTTYLSELIEVVLGRDVLDAVL